MRTLENSADRLAYYEDAPTGLVYIMIGISLINIIFPMEVLNKVLFPIKNEVTENTSFL